MPATFEKASREVKDMLKELLDSWEVHAPLVNAGVTFDVLMAFAEVDEKTGKKVGPALMHQGYPAHGIAKITNLEGRAKGLADASILLDGDAWGDMSVLQQKALLDHELYHFAVNIKHGAVQTDSHRRPKMWMRKHDFQAGWFSAVAQRYGPASGECEQAKQVWDEYGQAFWPDLCGGSLKKAAGDFVELLKKGGGSVSIHSGGKELFSTKETT
jgi:hypothetical protein